MSDRVDERLLKKLETKLKLSRSQVNRRIAATANEFFLSRNQAALKLAFESGVGGISQIADPDDLAVLRGSARAPSAPASAETRPATPIGRSGRMRSRAAARKRRPRKEPSNSVFVVHGRNDRIRDELYALLRSLGVNPIEWNKAIELSKSPAPYVGEIIEAGFKKAVAIVVLLTPDDEGQLKAEFRRKGDHANERRLTGQPRLNVVFEAGRAFGTHPNATILVQVGHLRPFSDISGRHVVHLSNSASSRQELATKLAAAGCTVDRSGTDWLTKGDFSI